MKSRLFRGALFLSLFILITISFYLIGHNLVIIAIFYPALIILIGVYLFSFLGFFDTIEKNSSIKYWEIKRDCNNRTIKKIWNFLFSFFSLFYSNLLIGITSIFFLYKLIPISNGDTTLLSFAGTTVVILVRFLVYSNVEIAEEIGKGFRYAMFPLGFTLFFWDFLYPLIKQHGYGFISYFWSKYNGMVIVLLIIVLLITSLDPIFYLFNNIRNSIRNIMNQGQQGIIDWMVSKLIKK